MVPINSSKNKLNSKKKKTSFLGNAKRTLSKKIANVMNQIHCCIKYELAIELLFQIYDNVRKSGSKKKNSCSLGFQVIHTRNNIWISQ